jgi:hypothetical protein
MGREFEAAETAKEEAAKLANAVVTAPGAPVVSAQVPTFQENAPAGNLILQAGMVVQREGGPRNVPEGSIIFKTGDGAECLRFDPGGGVFIFGSKVDQYQAIYDALREWFKTAHITRADGTEI